MRVKVITSTVVFFTCPDEIFKEGGSALDDAFQKSLDECEVEIDSISEDNKYFDATM